MELRGIFLLALVCCLSVGGVYSQFQFGNQAANFANQAVNTGNQAFNTANRGFTTILNPVSANFANQAVNTGNQVLNTANRTFTTILNPVSANTPTVSNFIVDGPAKVEEDDDFVQAGLDEINKIRRLYGAKPLQIDNELVKQAQATSDRLSRSRSRARRNIPAANSALSAGVSTTAGSKSGASVKAANEVHNKATQQGPAKGGKRKRDVSITHSDYVTAFVQMVWTGTDKLGVGVTETEPNNYIVVFRFSPLANVDADEYLDNLLNSPSASG